MGGKAKPFSISWSWTCSQMFRKFRCLENLRYLEWFKYGICSSLELEDRLWVIIFTQESVPRQAFIYLKSTIETQVKIIRLSTVLIINFGHNSLFFLVYFRWIWTSKCLSRPTLLIYKRWNNLLPQLLTDVQKS